MTRGRRRSKVRRTLDLSSPYGALGRASPIVAESSSIASTWPSPPPILRSSSRNTSTPSTATSWGSFGASISSSPAPAPPTPRWHTISNSTSPHRREAAKKSRRVIHHNEEVIFTIDAMWERTPKTCIICGKVGCRGWLGCQRLKKLLPGWRCPRCLGTLSWCQQENNCFRQAWDAIKIGRCRICRLRHKGNESYEECPNKVGSW